MASQFAESRMKLLNNHKNAVDEALQGLTVVNRNLTTICEGRVVIRSDVDHLKQKGQVTLISGGGSGHEPAWAGYVGPGMLTAGICGNIFASPPTSTIYETIVKCAANNPGGCLAIVKNYTGDRVNFGLAIERAKSRGLKCQMVIGGEDCALQSADRSAGRRGLCGVMLVDKIAGAMADQGKSLEEIYQVCQSVIANMGTIGVSVGPITLPGSDKPLFELKSGQLELGLGIHGEAGIRKCDFMPAKDLVAAMFSHMTNPKSATHLNVDKGQRVVVIVNNLGGLSCLELSVLANDVYNLLVSKSITIDRTYCGSFCTALEMPGFSITLLKSDDHLLNLMDADCQAPGWKKPWDSGCPTSVSIDELDEYQTCKPLLAQAPKISQETGGLVKSCILAACKKLVESEASLDELDRGCGDGDCGATMAQGAQAIKDFIEKASDEVLTTPAALCDSLSAVTEKAMGGTSGALYSLMFSAASSELLADVSFAQAIKAFAAGIDAIMLYGRALQGDRTMLDALLPALDSLKKSKTQDIETAFQKCAEAASQGAESTAGMKAKSGRASYTDVKSQSNVDPGAKAVSIWMNEMANVVAGMK